MTQKDKVKELVGRSLNSYHTKSLQQIDRIEKKNKEQNHKISILSNELDNDYLTKTEEGSVISLEHSKEGMVYLDELQGNTLVNYCTDSSKELTLNGDIDVEGTFVTTTEGVDNGKVDVVCEGNTLVNAILENTQTVSLPHFISKDKLNIKPNTTYTILSSSSKLVADFEEFQPIQDGLLCWVDGKDLDTSTNIWKDRSLNNNNIILNNIRLNGDSSCSGIDSSSYAKLDITIPPSYTIETVFTYTDITKIGALWYMGDSSNSSHKYDYFWNYSDNGGSLSYRRKNASDTWITHDSLFFLKKDEVYRSVITYNGTTKMARLYINGTFIKEVNMPNYKYYNTNTVLLMNNSTASGERTLSNGKIFSFMMYDRVLTEDEISYNDSYKQAKLSNESRIIKNVVTTPNNIANVGLRLNGSDIVKDVILLEGDWTNKEVPSYFEGMKSVGELEDNKIEILSKTPNDIDDVTKYLAYSNRVTIEKINNHSFRASADGGNTWQQVGFRHELLNNVKPNDKFTLFIESATLDNQYVENVGFAFRNVKKNIVISNTVTLNKNKPLENVLIHFTVPSDYNGTDLLEFRMHINQNTPFENSITINNFLFTKGHFDISSFKPYGLNKKEILMNEPLRKANDFYIDRLVKIGNKCYIERNTKEVVLDGTHNVAISGTSVKDETLCRFDFTINGLIKGSNGGEDKKFICDKLPYLFIHTLAGGSTNVAQECISNHSTNENSLNMVIKKSRLETIDVTGVNKWLSNNNIKIIIPIATPIYEPLEIEPTLNTYNDITHISNNSIIPCNMKIQNSGYNAIIKPSTLYTVALDTNKSGTIGMNLGGAKVTTTNNVATVTTPATLTDDSLRLYGKGIKGSKVRILEGDKTNWIPSYFEGMKSSFEDKVQEDGTYKMEILSNNKNLFDCSVILTQTNTLADYSFKNNVLTFNQVGQGGMCIPLYVKKGYKYYFNGITSNIVNVRLYTPNNYGGGGNIFSIREGVNNTNVSSVYNCNKSEWVMLRFWKGEGISTVTNFTVTTEPVGDFMPRKSNKIQFLLDEPLRKIDDILKDKFTFKDGKLMIERNCIEKTLDGSETWHNDGEVKNGYLCCYINNTTTNMSNYSKRTFKCNILPYEEAKRFNYEQATRSGAGFLEFILKVNTSAEFRQKISELRPTVIVGLAEPIYEEVPYELQKIILEGYENGTLFIDTNIPPTSTVTYAGETPIVKATKLNKTEVLNNTEDINDNIIPYLMDMDYRVVMLQLATEELEGGVSMARLFGGTYEMIKRDILSKRLTREEYGYRLADYFNAGKLTEEQVRELEELR